MCLRLCVCVCAFYFQILTVFATATELCLFQKNEAGSSQAMELLGFKRAMDQFLRCGIDMKAFVSDQHLAIAKHIREDYPSICHYYDLWHLKKSE